MDKEDKIIENINETSNYRDPAIWVNRRIKELEKDENLETDDISDGWHTFGELYEFRLAYNALAFNLMNQKDRLISMFTNNFKAHKSWKHNDGEWCFGEEKKWFIVAAQIPILNTEDNKQVVTYKVITNHYKAEHWNLFKIPEMEKSIFPYDGHTPQDSLDRIFNFLNNGLF